MQRRRAVAFALIRDFARLICRVSADDVDDAGARRLMIRDATRASFARVEKIFLRYAYATLCVMRFFAPIICLIRRQPLMLTTPRLFC